MSTRIKRERLDYFRILSKCRDWERENYKLLQFEYTSAKIKNPAFAILDP